MNMKRLFIFAALLASITFTALAQENTNATISSSDKHNMMLKVVELFEDYEHYCGIDEDFSEYASSFCSLFVNSDAPVFNDIIGIAFGESLTAKDYSQLLSEQSMTTRVSISSIDNQSLYFENGKWKLKCSFNKNVNITNTCGFEFASDFFNESDYILNAIIVYDIENNLCQFERIDGSAKSKRLLEQNFRVVKKTNESDTIVLYNGKPLDFNAMDQAFISSFGKFAYPKDPEIVVKEEIDDEQCRLLHLKFDIKPWRIKAHYDFSLGNCFELDGKDMLSSSKTRSNNLGIDFGFIFSRRGILKVGIFSGIGLSQSVFELLYSNTDYSIQSYADVDGDNYSRHYQNLRLSQKLKISDLNIPLYFDFNFYLSKSMSLYLDLGARYDMNMSQKIDAFDGRADVYGVYPKYGNLTLNEHWPYNGFGYHQFDSSDLLSSDLLDVKKNTINGIGSFGVRYNLPNIPLSIELGANYVMGLNNLIETSNVIDPNYTPVVYNTISGTVNSEHVHNLSEMLRSVKRKQLNVSLGVILKL